MKDTIRSWHFGEEPLRKKGPPKGDLYVLAVMARRQGRNGLADDIGDAAKFLKMIEGRLKYKAHTTIEGKGSSGEHSIVTSHGDDDLPAEIDASLAIRDVAQRLREIVSDW